MKVEFQSFADPGKIAKERVVLKVSADVDLGAYMILQSSVYENGLGATSGDQPRAYWFPSQKVKKDDLVVVYTKDGEDSTKKLKTGETVYFYYWGLDEPVWGDGQHVCVILETNAWSVSGTGGPEAE